MTAWEPDASMSLWTKKVQVLECILSVRRVSSCECDLSISACRQGKRIPRKPGSSGIHLKSVRKGRKATITKVKTNRLGANSKETLWWRKPNFHPVLQPANIRHQCHTFCGYRQLAHNDSKRLRACYTLYQSISEMALGRNCSSSWAMR